MIKYSEHRVGLVNLETTFKAIENIDKLIKHYSEDKPGPAYCQFSAIGIGEVSVQFRREIILDPLNQQREKLTSYLKTMGIDYDQ